MATDQDRCSERARLLPGGAVNGGAPPGGSDARALRTRPARWRTAGVFALASGAALLCYLIRTLPSIAMEGERGIATQLNWTNTDKGTVDSALFYGYITTQIPGGWLAGRVGAKPVLLGVVVLSCVTTALLPLAALADGPQTVVFASVARAATGLAQGPLYPCWAQLASSWLRSDEQSFWCCAFSAGAAFGIVVRGPRSHLAAHAALPDRVYCRAVRWRHL